MYTYLIINIASILIPVAFSFHRGLGFYRKWKHLFPALFLTMVLFIPWDIAFTEYGVWGFNKRYLTGIEIVNLPIEEWMFFIFIPYACVFTYEVLNYYIKKPLIKDITIINYVNIIVLLVLGIIFYDRIYTFITFILTAIFIAIHQFFIKQVYLNRFYIAYLVIMLPFFIVNGLLTGAFFEEEVVWYNNSENMGIRIITIPVEDFVYNFLMLGLGITIFETLQRRSARKTLLNKQ